MGNELSRFLESLTPSTKLFFGALLFATVIVAIWTGLIPVDDEGQATLISILSGVLLFALRQYSASAKEQVSQNTQLTAETAENVDKLQQLTINYVQQTQLLQAAQLENAVYRKVFNRIRNEPACTVCAQMVAKEFEGLRTRE